ncbi:neutral cholesterol ester hydrolase 1 [Periophthalmus magnuspinnatus]|uniref:neutral cholesterol ester hydrolase 1 n=1 Tax=Periophthalmus magnuspinnatus TaxID=409849 RepID=UPI00145BBDFC|nr:neutral cholesterol ester hydrolase 1 [Periophthalmus magnuspinnatus]
MRLNVTAAVLLSAAAYYVYLPLPPGVCEPWKLMLLDALFRSFMTAGDVLHSLGVLHRVHLLNHVVSLVEEVPARSCSALHVTDSALAGIPTRVYRPRAGQALKRGVLYFHGGGWALGSARMRSYDLLCRKMAEDLDAVIMSVDYGLAPESVFPAPYLDALSASRSFLSADTWDRFGLDPNRLCISGDSAGGNLAAAVTQTLSSDPSLPTQPRVQALVYPVLQALDFQTSSYQQNQAVPILYRPVMARFWLQYLDADPLLEPSILNNLHSCALDPITRSKINWTVLVPAHIRKHYRPIAVDTSTGAELAPVFLDVRAAPLLADDVVLSRTPKAYILTCEFDILRDDGMMYARRLRDAGVTVTSDHYDDGFHGCMVFANLPMMSSVGRRSMEGFIRWLDQNL